MEVFLKAASVFISIITICALVVTACYMVDIMDKIKKRKDESEKEK